MSVDQDLQTVDETDIERLATQLGNAITELPEYQTFVAAKEKVQSTDELQQQIQEFEEERREFMLAKQTGEATQEDAAKLQRMQQELNNHPIMVEYLDAKEELQDELEPINEMISDPLEIDFGGEAGGCCHD
ncbi:MAG: YlbF family regulator [Halobacteriaceae archaeon]